jgi:aminopeptidase-like protein
MAELPHAEPEQLGREMYALIEELYPICRSITGNGLRQTLAILQRLLPITCTEVSSGTPVLDWTVPREWNIRDAWIANSRGERVVDFRTCNLHVVNYSAPVRATLSLEELRRHCHTLPKQPELIPYRTSYYDESWGFCMSQNQLDALEPGEYEVCIDSSLEPGSLTYGEFVLPGELEDEILISTHVCHPSLCDDNLSGIAVSIFLARALLARGKPRHTLRFLYAPGTIGAITWLAVNHDRARRIKHGLTLTCLGDSHHFTYKRTLHGGTSIDDAASHVLATLGTAHEVIDFFPYGYDERQYNSPGFRIAVGSLMRGRHGMFPEYHTSADNLQFVSPERLVESFRIVRAIVDALEGDRKYINLAPFGEPQLGSRGLYRALGGTNVPDLQLAMLWVLNLSDGEHGLLAIARRAKVEFSAIRVAADLLLAHGLLREVGR